LGIDQGAGGGAAGETVDDRDVVDADSDRSG
jgi:hypothetical protein